MNKNGDRIISINSANNPTGNRDGFITGKAISYTDTVLSFWIIKKFTKNETITLRGYQNSGTNINVYASIQYVRIK